MWGFKGRKVYVIGMLAILLTIGALLRVHYTDWNKTSFEMSHRVKLGGDEVGYDKAVRQWIDKGFYGFTPFAYSSHPNAFTTPGYPLFLLLLYKVFGYGEASPIAAIQAVQIVLDLTSAQLLYWLAYRLFRKHSVAAPVMLLYAVHPSFTHLPSYLLTETLYVFAMMLFLHALLSLHSSRTSAASFLAGASFAALILVRPAAAPFAMLLALYALRHVRSKRPAARSVLLLAAGVLLLMGPWWLRNGLMLHKPVLLAEQAGNPLLWGSYPYEANPKVDVSESSEAMGKAAMERIRNGFRSEPILYLKWYTIGKAQVLTDHVYIGFEPQTNTQYDIWNRNLIYVGAAGLLLSLFHRGYRSKLGGITLFALLSFAAYLPFAPTPRYFVPVLPLLFLGVGYCLHRVIRFIAPNPSLTSG